MADLRALSASEAAALVQAAEMVRAADALVIAAGAGMGVDSGLPDFRGDAGFWRAYPALGRAQMNFYATASAENFQCDPTLAWGFYGHRLALYRQTQPHLGFAILQKWAQQRPAGAVVFTSNVDGQFQQAGFAEAVVHECHGSIHYVQCSRPCGDGVRSAKDLAPRVDAEQCQWLGPLPQCRDCGAVLRPNILMFGDDAWLAARSAVQEQRVLAQLQAWLEAGLRPLVIELGAGTAVPSVRHFGASVCRAFAASEAALLRINARESAVARPCDVGLALGALQALRAMDALLEARP